MCGARWSVGWTVVWGGVGSGVCRVESRACGESCASCCVNTVYMCRGSSVAWVVVSIFRPALSPPCSEVTCRRTTTVADFSSLWGTCARPRVYGVMPKCSASVLKAVVDLKLTGALAWELLECGCDIGATRDSIVVRFAVMCPCFFCFIA